MSALTIRTAREADVPVVRELALRTPEAPNWSSNAYRSFLPTHVSPGLARVLLVAERAGSVCGFAAASAFPPEAELESIVVAEESRRSAIGTQLLRALRLWAREERAETMLLEVRSRNVAAQRFYTRSGFVPSGLRPRYYKEPVDDAVQMRLPLLTTEFQHVLFAAEEL